MKLATKLVVLFLLVSVIPLAIVGYLAYDNGRQTIEQNALNHLICANILKEDMLNVWVHGNKQRLEQLAMRPSIVEYTAMLVWLDKADPDYQTVHGSILEEHLIPTLEEGGFLELFILRGSDGLVLVSTDENQERNYRESTPYFVGGRSSTYIRNVYYSPSLEKSVMTMSTPIRDEEGNLIAELAGHVNLVGMSEVIMQASGLSQTEQTYLVNKLGFFVTEPWFSDGYDLEKALHTDGVEACLEHNDGFGFYDDYRGVPVIGAYRWMPEWELCILTEVEQAEAFAPIVTLRNTVLGIGLAIALILALLGVFFNRTLIWPLRRLVKGTEEISRGNLEYRVSTTVKDEIGQLSRAFDQMTEDLKVTTVSRDKLVKEVAQRKCAEEQLRQSEEKLRLMFESVTEGITVSDLAGNITQTNDAVVRMHGYDNKEELIGRSAFELMAEKDRVRAMENLRKTLEGGHSGTIEYTFLRRDGMEFDAELSAATLRDASDNPVGFIAVTRDITERKHMQEQLIVTGRLASVGELASGIAHELNNPLTSVIGFSQLLMERDVSNDIREDLGVVCSEAERVAQVVENLLTFARKHPSTKQPVNVNSLIGNVLELRAYEHQVSNIQVVNKFAPHLPQVMGDHFQLQQVFLNIILNAEQSMIEAHNRGKLTINTEKAGDIVRISFSDDGGGIPEENLRCIFDPFFTTKDVGKGTGLGLSMSYGIVTEHGGRIYAESELGKGATFYVELPISTADRGGN